MKKKRRKSVSDSANLMAVRSKKKQVYITQFEGFVSNTKKKRKENASYRSKLISEQQMFWLRATSQKIREEKEAKPTLPTK